MSESAACTECGGVLFHRGGCSKTDENQASPVVRDRLRHWTPLVIVVTFTLGMSLSISYGEAAAAGLQGLIAGLYFWDAIDSLPRRHHGG